MHLDAMYAVFVYGGKSKVVYLFFLVSLEIKALSAAEILLFKSADEVHQVVSALVTLLTFRPFSQQTF